MAKRIIDFIYIVGLYCIFNFHSTLAQEVENNLLETYIVHVSIPKDRILSEPQDHETYYNSFLPEASVSSNDPTPILKYSYKHVASGFAAKLTNAHLKFMEKKEGFLSAQREQILALHTTHTPNFLGLQQNSGVWQGFNYGKGVIIGVLDSGITPKHPSFSDKGVPPPPKKWKGKCDYGKIVCNNKVIGARSFVEGPEMTDNDGHGTHTSGTAAGNFVKDANVFGQANGTAVGMAPLAHVAMYQVCYQNGCSDANILAAMDAAIDDGVDILSLSIGGVPYPFFSDSVAFGAFAAVQKGISVICSAGNDGPFQGTVTNGAPWILTVGASTMDRRIGSTAVLGNQKQYDGETLYQPSDFLPTPLPLVYAGAKNPNSSFCGDFNDTDVFKGKVVLCERGGNISRIYKGRAVKEAGGLAMILMNDEANAYSTLADPHVLPAVHVSYAAGIKIKKYINSTASPTAAILFQGTEIGGKTAPVVTSFSSRGPNRPSPGILKPDIIGPGVNVLAAWPVSVDNTKTRKTFNMISGTSMSCPHLSGVAALLKSAHPEWSPAAIKSAIMTTTDVWNLDDNLILDEELRPADMFAVGAGHVNASRASDPGIIFDIKPEDYVPYLCGLNYTDEQVGIITHIVVNCSEVTVIPEAGLNYPSFAVALGGENITYTRTVTNVGPAKSVYKIFVVNPPGVEVSVKPKTLEFSEVNEKITYEVAFSRLASVPRKTNYVQGYLIWLSDRREHYVLSPLSVKMI